MFYDWLAIYQDHDHRLPVIGDCEYLVVCALSGEELGSKQPTLKHSGSYSTVVLIRISGNRVTVTGNPSRIDRLENLFGYSTLDQCVRVFNEILAKHGLPPFTKATKLWHGVGEDGKRVRTFTDGAVITELHITTNKAIGQGNEDDYLKGLSTLPYRHSIPRLHTNGKTCDWLTKTGKGGRLIYPSVYNKAFELSLHSQPKLKRSHGETSPEYKYLRDVIDYCEQNGVVRFEQKLKSEFLRRNHFAHYGFIDEDALKPVHEEFLNLDGKLQVEAMTLESITQRLINEGICANTRAANTTTIYAIQWMHGTQFDFSKKQVQTHRARLRKIGIDIALSCDLSKFSLISVKESRTVVARPLPMPAWYRKPEVKLQLAA